ncbi:MAG: hypothetical protein ACTSRZ_14835, partial [Promethearchaeota archaeon]
MSFEKKNSIKSRVINKKSKFEFIGLELFAKKRNTNFKSSNSYEREKSFYNYIKENEDFILDLEMVESGWILKDFGLFLSYLLPEPNFAKRIKGYSIFETPIICKLYLNSSKYPNSILEDSFDFLINYFKERFFELCGSDEIEFIKNENTSNSAIINLVYKKNSEKINDFFSSISNDDIRKQAYYMDIAPQSTQG